MSASLCIAAPRLLQSRLLQRPLAAKLLEEPAQVQVQQGSLPAVQGDRLRYELPA